MWIKNVEESKIVDDIIGELPCQKTNYAHVH